MGLNLCKCCCWTRRNGVNNSNNRDFNVILLGQENVGKTEIGCILAGTRRTLYEPTNGVQCYQVYLPNYSISITEIGGNREMQKLWHHYYAKTMGLIFCYDMSAAQQEMQKSFQLLNQIASHPFMSGKAVLLVGTKSDLASDTIQLYDIENAFALESLANRYYSSLKSTHFNPNELNSLWGGIDWLAGYLEINYKLLKGRIKYDAARERLLTKRNYRIKRFSLSHRRPKTAPANLGPMCTTSPSPPSVLPAATQQQSKNVFRIANDLAQPTATAPDTDEVPTTSETS